MWYREMKGENNVGKMLPIDLLDAGLPQIFNLLKNGVCIRFWPAEPDILIVAKSCTISFLSKYLIQTEFVIPFKGRDTWNSVVPKPIPFLQSIELGYEAVEGKDSDLCSLIIRSNNELFLSDRM